MLEILLVDDEPDILEPIRDLLIDRGHHVTTASGGHGAARECCDLLLVAAGRYAALLQGHLQTLDGA